jgi:hypothetical protein
MKKITTPLDRSDNKVLSDSPKKKKKSERKEKKSKGVFLLARAFSSRSRARSIGEAKTIER